MEAPLSSPSLPKQQNQHSYFTRSSKPSTAANSTAPQAPQSQAAQPLPRADDGTSLFLKDHTLLFEAAKRAQMAVMMREFEGVGI